MKKIAVCTTFNDKGLQSYAQRMIDSFIVNWPTEVELHLYPEGCNPAVRDHSRTHLVWLDDVAELSAFKNKWKGIPKANGDVSNDPIRNKRKDAGKGFKWDAVRFAHKVYTIFHCAKNTDADILIWMDADMYCHSPITIDQLNALCGTDKDLCFLGRKNKFSECGLYSMNLRSDRVQAFLKKFQDFYDNAETGIFTLEEWHDSYVFDSVRRTMKLDEWNWSEGLVKGEGHPLINSAWGAYLDHLKGARKQTGKSHQTDLIVARTEPYWKNK